jgi:hypothetical protein
MTAPKSAGERHGEPSHLLICRDEEYQSSGDGWPGRDATVRSGK